MPLYKQANNHRVLKFRHNKWWLKYALWPPKWCSYVIYQQGLTGTMLTSQTLTPGLFPCSCPPCLLSFHLHTILFWFFVCRYEMELWSRQGWDWSKQAPCFFPFTGPKLADWFRSNVALPYGWWIVVREGQSKRGSRSVIL